MGTTGAGSGTNQYVSGEYLRKYPDWHESDAPWKARGARRILERNRTDPRTVADVGCGSGGALRELAGLLGPETQFTGYDISPQAVALASAHTAPNLRFVCGDFLESSRERFDVVLLLDVFEHVEDYLGFLRRLKARGSAFVFHIPLDMHVQGVLRDAQLDARRAAGHLHYFSRATALATLEDAGYDVLDWFYTRSSVELGSGQRGWRTRLANVPRRLLFPVLPHLAVKLFGGFSMMVLAR